MVRQRDERGREARERRETDVSSGFQLPAALMAGGSSRDGSGELDSQKNTNTVCIHSLHTNSHSYTQTLLTMILTSVGEVGVALSLNAVGGHWAQ